MSQEGLPLADYTAQQTAIRGNQAAGLHAQGQSANPTGVAGIVRQSDQATGQLNAQDAIQRNRNLLTLLQERQTLAQQKDKQWDWNLQQKYLSNLAKSQALKTSGNANVSSAFSDLSGGAATAAKIESGQTPTTPAARTDLDSSGTSYETFNPNAANNSSLYHPIQ